MIEFKRADKHDISKLKELWLECFEDTNKAVDLFFDKNLGSMKIFCVEDNKKIVSALYLLDTSLNGQKAHYLCGASTSLIYRGQGIMSRLIDFALDSERRDGCKFSVLMPASDSLYGYYSKLGYLPNCSVQKRMYLRNELIGLADEKASENNTDFESNCLLWSDSFKSFACEYYSIYGSKFICSDGCFAIFDESGDCAEVFYSACSDKNLLAQKLLEKTQAENFIFFEKTKDNSDKEKYGMIKSLDKNTEVPKDVFIGITLM